ncbi:MAG: hypothetical protein ACMUIU_15885 [bacterium]
MIIFYTNPGKNIQESYKIMNIDMETLSDTKIINQMLNIEKNACQIVENAIEKGNKVITEAREEAERLIEKRKQELSNDLLALEKKLQEETEKEAARIKAEKQQTLEMIDKQTISKKELTIKKICEFLFKQIMDDR